jgi:hypothetical protein
LSITTPPYLLPKLRVKKNIGSLDVTQFQGLQCGVFGVLFTLHLTQYTKCNDGVKKTVGVSTAILEKHSTVLLKKIGAV